MPRFSILPLLLAGLLLLLAPSVRAAPLSAAEFRELPHQAVVDAIGDGDSLHVHAGERRFTVRLACIDAPELAQLPDGPASRRALQQRLPRGAHVRLIPRDIDRYGRLVAEVIGGENLNLAQVADGRAFVDRRHVQRCSPREYLDAELRACRDRFGVWRVEGGIERPWEFRARHPRRRSRAQLSARPSGLGIGRRTATPITSRTPAA